MPGPWEYMDVAKRAMDVDTSIDMEKLFRGDWRSYSEQMQAADRDTQESITMAGEVLGTKLHPIGQSPEGIALQLALAHASLVNIPQENRCPHHIDFTRTVVVSLSVGMMACRECMPAILTRIVSDWKDDGLCELCGAESEIFHDTITAAASRLYIFNACERCHQWIADA